MPVAFVFSQHWAVVSQLCCLKILGVHSLKGPKTNRYALKTGHPKRKQSYANHPFSGDFAVSLREGTSCVLKCVNHSDCVLAFVQAFLIEYPSISCSPVDVMKYDTKQFTTVDGSEIRQDFRTINSIKGKSLKFTIHLDCFIPAKWAI